jgi:hypothetical protein
MVYSFNFSSGCWFFDSSQGLAFVGFLKEAGLLVLFCKLSFCSYLV